MTNDPITPGFANVNVIEVIDAIFDELEREVHLDYRGRMDRLAERVDEHGRGIDRLRDELKAKLERVYADGASDGYNSCPEPEADAHIDQVLAAFDALTSQRDGLLAAARDVATEWSIYNAVRLETMNKLKAAINAATAPATAPTDDIDRYDMRDYDHQTEENDHGTAS